MYHHHVRPRLRCALLALAVLPLWSAPVLGQTATSDDARVSDEVRALFEQGVEASQGERWDEAVDLFRRALAQHWSPIIAYNLALSLAERGDLLEAHRLVKRIETDLLQTELVDLSRYIEERLAWLRIDPQGNPDGVTIRIDGEPMTEVPGTEVPVDPGAHTVVADRGGQAVATRDLTVAAGERQQLSIELPPPPAAPPAHEPARVRPYKKPGFAVMGGAAVVLVVAGGLGLAARALHDELEEQCAPMGVCEPGRADDIDRLQALDRSGDALLGVGLIAAATGVVLVLLKGDPPDDAPSASEGPSVGFACGRRGCDVALKGTF